MSNAAVIDGMGFTGTAQPVMRQQMPLSFLKAGERAHISKVRGKGEVHHHLENLGFVDGAEVFVVSEQGGNLIIEVKGTQVALEDCHVLGSPFRVFGRPSIKPLSNLYQTSINPSAQKRCRTRFMRTEQGEACSKRSNEQAARKNEGTSK